jgi:hypothetical protein
MSSYDNVTRFKYSVICHQLMSAFFLSAPEKGDIWSIKYTFDPDTIVRHKDELTGLGCFILIDTLLNKTNMK